jgi:hypothetical protein
LPAAAALLAGAFWLRLTIFAPTELGLDGLVSAAMSHQGAAYVVAYSLRDVHPPLYYLLLTAWLNLIGPTFLATRWTALAAGLLACALAFSLLRRQFGTRVAGYGLALLAVAPAAVLFSATARDFALGMALSVLSWWTLVWLGSGATRSRARSIPVALVTCAALLTWYFHAAVWAVQLAYALRVRGRALAGLLLGAGLAAPWYLLMVSRLQPWALAAQFGAAGEGSPPGPDPFLLAAGRALAGDLPAGLSPAWLLPIWVAGVAGGALLIARRRRTGLAALLAAGVLLGLAAAWLVYRFWIGSEALTRFFLIPGFFGAALLAAALGRLPRAGALATLGILVVVGLYFYRDYLGVRVGDPPRQTLQTWLGARLVPSDLAVSDDLADVGYLWLSGTPGALALLHSHAKSYLIDRSPERLVGELDRPAPPERAVWRIRWDEPLDENRLALDTLLIERWRPRAGFAVAGRQIAEFRGAPEWVPADARFGAQLRLEAASLPDYIAAGTDLPVVLRWRAEAAVDADYKVFVHLLDGGGALAGQHDSPPAVGLRPTRDWSPGTRVTDLHWVPVAPTVSPGRYHVEVGLYREDVRLPLADGRNSYTVGSVEVVAMGNGR